VRLSHTFRIQVWGESIYNRSGWYDPLLVPLCCSSGGGAFTPPTYDSPPPTPLAYQRKIHSPQWNNHHHLQNHHRHPVVPHCCHPIRNHTPKTKPTERGGGSGARIPRLVVTQTTLGLCALSFPGIWSQSKRSTKAKTKRKTFSRLG